MARFENWGDYWWPDALDECRVNIPGIRDATKLATFEAVVATVRQQELVRGEVEIPQTFDLDHLNAIHRHLFQDVYEWAGELRVTEQQRPSADPTQPGHAFVAPEDLERLAGVVMGQVGDPSTWRDLIRAEQLERLAATYAGVNLLHPYHDVI